ncbi:hypothetical protein ACWGST_13940 [Agromyces sp. NPDC055520]
MSTEPDRADAAEPIQAEPTTQVSESRPASSVAAVLAEVEARPLAERAEGYQALAERLRTQLEHSDPSLRT